MISTVQPFSSPSAPVETEDLHYLHLAISLAARSERVATAYSVGAVLATPDGVLATGYSRELPGNTHAEEVCFLKLPEATCLDTATLYTTMEPCSRRLSGKPSCLEQILQRQVKRVVMGVREPALFVRCTGRAALEAAGVTLVQYPELDDACWAPNRHLDAAVARAKRDAVQDR